jgi:hypothetical protein
MAIQGFNPNASGSGGLITSATATPMAETAAQADRPRSAKFSSATPAQIAADYANFAPALKRAYSQKLKSAGYKVPVSSKYNTIVRDALITAYENLTDELTFLNAVDQTKIASEGYDLDSFLNQRIADKKSLDSGNAKKPRSYTTIYGQETASNLVTTLYRDLTGTNPTQDIIDKYTKDLQKQQAQNPDIVTQSDTGQKTQTGMGQAESQQYLIEKISKTDPARMSKVKDAYSIFAEEMGISI